MTLDGLLRAGATDSSIVDPERRPSSWGWNASAGRTRGPPHCWRLRGRVLTLEDIFRSIRRRWRLAAGIFLLACIGVGVFVFTRERDKPPIRYRAVVTVQIAPPAPKAPSNGKKTPTTVSAATGGASPSSRSPRRPATPRYAAPSSPRRVEPSSSVRRSPGRFRHHPRGHRADARPGEHGCDELGEGVRDRSENDRTRPHHRRAEAAHSQGASLAPGAADRRPEAGEAAARHLRRRLPLR